MDECKNRAAGSLDWKDGEQEMFEKSAGILGFDILKDAFGNYVFPGTEAAWVYHQTIQPEIDALIHDNGNMLKAITEYDKENVALKAENEALRKQIDTMSATCVILNHSVGGMKAENEKLRNVASEAIAAIGSAIDGRDVCFDTVIENLMVAMTAPDTKGE